MLFDSGLYRLVILPSVKYPTVTGMIYIPFLLKRSFITGWRKLEIFLGGMPTIWILCFV